MSVKIRFNDINLQKHDHIVIYCSQNKSIIYNDARRFGFFDFCRTEDIHKSNYLKNLGIEPFDANLTPKFSLILLKIKKSNKTGYYGSKDYHGKWKHLCF
jgi:formamidopyrimidine-DNA glycosylase